MLVANLSSKSKYQAYRVSLSVGKNLKAAPKQNSKHSDWLTAKRYAHDRSQNHVVPVHKSKYPNGDWRDNANDR